MRQPDPGHDASEAQVLADVAEYGVHIVHVLEDEDDDAEPRFSYTVGLWHGFEQPEIVVFGLPEDVAHELLNAVADNVAEGARYLAGTRHEDLLRDYAVRMLGIDPTDFAEYFGVARWAYEGDDFRAVQLAYPDKQGRWPWDTTTREGFRRCQPVIGRREA